MVNSAAVVVVYLLVAVLGAFVWRASVHSAVWTRVPRGAQMSEVVWGRVFNADAVFVLVTAVAGIGLGVISALWHLGDPRVRVVVVAVAGGLSSFVMARVGLWIGPPDPLKVMRSAPVGSTAPVRLELASHAAYVVWPFASLAGLLLVLLIVLVPDAVERPGPAAHADPGAGEDPRNLQ